MKGERESIGQKIEGQNMGYGHIDKEVIIVLLNR